MKQFRLNRLIVALISASVLASLTLAPAGAAGNAPPTHGPAAAVCPGPEAPGAARCHAWVRTDGNGKPAASGTPRGYVPSDLWSAYNLPSLAGAPGSGPLVAIVDAYDDPNAENDMNVYRSQFGLGACTTANGCFRKVNQNGATSPLPGKNANWALEISLDLDMVSAICPTCRILLVEAKSAFFSDLSTGVNTAAALGAVAISNSYGGGEWSGETGLESAYNHRGVTASSGDNGYGVEYPAASAYVTAVGGTSLTRSTSARGWSETAWSGAGSGCSAFIAKPAWQKDAGCAKRTVADVSAVADPNTGVAVYDSYQQSGWLQVGGTSAGAPLIAALYGRAGNSINNGSLPYGNPTALNDVASGSNGSCGGSYLCTAGSGYDGPTGLGTPNGTGGF